MSCPDPIGVHEKIAPFVPAEADRKTEWAALAFLLDEHPNQLTVAEVFWALNCGGQESSDQKNHDREVPVPASLAALLEALPDRDDTDLLFPAPRGGLWRERNFYRDVWTSAKLATGLDPTPHEFRHSYVTHLRAAGIDDADLARVAGHRIETMISVYTHPLERSHEAIRQTIG